MKKNTKYLFNVVTVAFVAAFFCLVGLKVHAQNSNPAPVQGQSTASPDAGSANPNPAPANQAPAVQANPGSANPKPQPNFPIRGLSKDEEQDLQKKYPELGDCAKYYKFGSVTVELTPNKPAYFSGDKVVFSGKIKNQNSFPITNGNLWIQIMRDNPQGEDKNGYNLITQFLAKDNIYLEAGENQNISFAYQVPKSLSQDKYFAASFFTIADSYNMAGATFLEHIWASLTPFGVENSLQKAVYLDKNSVLENGEKITFRSPTKAVKAGEDVKIDFKAVNERQTREDFTIKYQFYHWDTLKKQNLLKETSENITLNPGETKDLGYTIPQIVQGTYELRMVAQSPTVESMLDIRLTTERVQQGRINFATLDQFPLQKDQPAKFIACFHNGGQGVFDGTVDIALKDEKGNMIEQKNFSGTVIPNFLAIADDFTAKDNYDYLALTATIKDGDGKIMDQVTTVYDKRQNKGVTGQAQAGFFEKYLPIIVIGVLLVILVLVLVVLIKRRKQNGLGKFGIFLLIVFASAAFFALTGAKSARASGTFWFNDIDGWISVGHGWIALQPHCLFKDASGNCLSSGASVNVGDRITAPLLWDGEWYASGGASDTPPYGGGAGITVCGRHRCAGAWASGSAYLTNNNISASDPAKASVTGQQVTALQSGSVNLTLDTTFSASTNVDGDGWYYDDGAEDASSQSRFTLNIISNCTSAWTDWSACVSHRQTRHDNAGCALADETQPCNSAPSVPSVSGPANGDISTSYNFTAAGSVDPDGDNIQYQFDWGDGSPISTWTSSVPPGASSNLSHAYSVEGAYDIKAQAQDINGALSGWSTPFSFSASCGARPACATIGNLCTGDAPSSCADLSNPCATGSSCSDEVRVAGKTVHWTCSNSCGVRPCSQVMSDSEPGQCGTANGTAFCQGILPTNADLCSTGAPAPGASSIDINSYDINWQCRGTCSGSSSSCKAKGTKTCGWIESNP